MFAHISFMSSGFTLPYCYCCRAIQPGKPPWALGETSAGRGFLAVIEDEFRNRSAKCR